MDVDCQVSKFATPVSITTETEHGSPVMSLSVITDTHAQKIDSYTDSVVPSRNHILRLRPVRKVTT